MNEQKNIVVYEDTLIALDIEADQYYIAPINNIPSKELHHLPHPNKRGGLPVLAWRPYASALAEEKAPAPRIDVLRSVYLSYRAARVSRQSFQKLVTNLHQSAIACRATCAEPTHRLAQLLTAHQRALRWLSHPVECLIGSAALALHAWHEGIDVQLQIGVQNYPFYAHAWVEHNGTVVNDHPDVREYLAPIYSIKTH